jgi:hypothetical protein
MNGASSSSLISGGRKIPVKHSSSAQTQIIYTCVLLVSERMEKVCSPAQQQQEAVVKKQWVGMQMQ